MKCNLIVDLFSSLRVLYTPYRSPVVILSYGPEPLLRQLGLDTELIIVPFSSKDMNHVAYLAHVATVVRCCSSDNYIFNFIRHLEKEIKVIVYEIISNSITKCTSR